MSLSLGASPEEKQVLLRTMETFNNACNLTISGARATSKWCSHCGAVVSGHDSRNYALFRCRKCGLVVNSDRKASLAVAAKTLLERRGFPNQKIPPDFRQESPGKRAHADVSDDSGSDGSAYADP